MTLSLYSTYKSWKREKALQSVLVCPVSFPRSRKSSSVMRALAMVGLGVGGVTAGDDEHLHGIG
jgi:hypothetical protein